jgi:hypothetical protein
MPESARQSEGCCHIRWTLLPSLAGIVTPAGHKSSAFGGSVFGNVVWPMIHAKDAVESFARWCAGARRGVWKRYEEMVAHPCRT